MTSQSPAFRRTVAALMAAHNERMAERIRYYRQRESLSEAELAWKVGASERQVRRWEQAEHEPQPANLRALAEFFKVDIGDLRPDLEEEERQLAAQLERIETKLDLLLNGSARPPEVEGGLPKTPIRRRTGRPKQQSAG